MCMRYAGLSVLDLLVGLSLLAALTICSFPSLKDFVGRCKLGLEVHRLESVLELAAVQAQRREKKVKLILEPRRYAAVIDAEDGEVLRRREVPSPIEIILQQSEGRSGGGLIRFYPSGTASPGTITVENGTRACTIKISLRGRVKSAC